MKSVLLSFPWTHRDSLELWKENRREVKCMAGVVFHSVFSFHDSSVLSTARRKESLTTCFGTKNHCLKGQDYTQVCILIRTGAKRLRKKIQIFHLRARIYLLYRYSLCVKCINRYFLLLKNLYKVPERFSPRHFFFFQGWNTIWLLWGQINLRFSIEYLGIK